MQEEFDNFEEWERKDTKHKLPIGWLILFIGLIVWGIWYTYSFSPGTTGWTQEGEFKKSMEVKK